MAGGGIRAARNLSAGAVAAIAAWSSYSHMVHVALHYGERPQVAYGLPFSVDGMLVVATIVMVDDKRRSHRVRPMGRLAFTAGVIASIAANIAAAHPTIGARIVDAWPALALLLVVEMLARPPAAAAAQASTGAPSAASAAEPAGATPTPHRPAEVAPAAASPVDIARVRQLPPHPTAEVPPAVQASGPAAAASAAHAPRRHLAGAAAPHQTIRHSAEISTSPAADADRPASGTSHRSSPVPSGSARQTSHAAEHFRRRPAAEVAAPADGPETGVVERPVSAQPATPVAELPPAGSATPLAELPAAQPATSRPAAELAQPADLPTNDSAAELPHPLPHTEFGRAETGGTGAGRTGAQRRPTATTRQLALNIIAAEPHLSRTEVAGRLGVSTRRLREVLAS